MSRIVNFSKDYELVLKDRFGNPQGEFITYKKGENELEIPSHAGYYQSKNNERFFIYEGDGVLELESECIKEYNFENLNIVFLDFYLINQQHHAQADESDRKIVENFTMLFNLNEMCEKAKIVPSYYEKTLERLLGDIK